MLGGVELVAVTVLFEISMLCFPCEVKRVIAVFCGHAQVENRDAVEAWLAQVCRGLILEGVDTFYFGGYGGFDRLAAQTVIRLRRDFERVRSVLILPYLNTPVDTSLYDVTLYPPLETVPPRFAIARRNEWMVGQADVVVAYVTHPWGGAAKMLQCARRKQKRLMLYGK